MSRRAVWLLVAALVLVVLVGGAVAGAVVGLRGASTTGPSSATASPSSGSGAQLRRYVALGDSYTAAPGVPVTDTADPCLRSTSNYPSVVDAALHPESFADRSCSGAETGDLAGRQHAGATPLAPQLSALTTDTDLVTLGMGGNDFGLFGMTIGACAFVRGQDPTGSPCRTVMNRTGSDRLLSRLPGIRRRLTTALREITRRAPHARVLVVGYPQIVPASGTCPTRLPLATGDYAYARQVNRGLDRALRLAAVATGTTYLDVWRASAGHDICSATPWVNGRASDTGRAVPYHPFAVEQRAVAGLVEAAAGD